MYYTVTTTTIKSLWREVWTIHLSNFFAFEGFDTVCMYEFLKVTHVRQAEFYTVIYKPDQVACHSNASALAICLDPILMSSRRFQTVTARRLLLFSPTYAKLQAWVSTLC